MRDREFKQLRHCVGNNRVATRGKKVAPGYFPDMTVRDPKGHLLFIVEHESKTDRKALLGDVVKAEWFAEKENATPTLIIVMKRSNNATVKQIGNHLPLYSTWLAKLKGGRMSLSAIRIMEHEDYSQSLENKEEMGSPAFDLRTTCIPVTDSG